MHKLSRRDFLQRLSALTAAGLLPASIGRALALPAQVRSGTLADMEHVVILMQENRAFDHYFGTLRGVRGFDDPRPLRLRDGAPPSWRCCHTGAPSRSRSGRGSSKPRTPRNVPK